MDEKLQEVFKASAKTCRKVILGYLNTCDGIIVCMIFGWELPEDYCFWLKKMKRMTRHELSFSSYFRLAPLVYFHRHRLHPQLSELFQDELYGPSADINTNRLTYPICPMNSKWKLRHFLPLQRLDVACLATLIDPTCSLLNSMTLFEIKNCIENRPFYDTLFSGKSRLPLESPILICTQVAAFNLLRRLHMSDRFKMYEYMILVSFAVHCSISMPDQLHSTSKLELELDSIFKTQESHLPQVNEYPPPVPTESSFACTWLLNVEKDFQLPKIDKIEYFSKYLFPRIRFLATMTVALEACIVWESDKDGAIDFDEDEDDEDEEEEEEEEEEDSQLELSSDHFNFDENHNLILGCASSPPSLRLSPPAVNGTVPPFSQQQDPSQKSVISNDCDFSKKKTEALCPPLLSSSSLSAAAQISSSHLKRIPTSRSSRSSSSSSIKAAAVTDDEGLRNVFFSDLNDSDLFESCQSGSFPIDKDEIASSVSESESSFRPVKGNDIQIFLSSTKRSSADRRDFSSSTSHLAHDQDVESSLSTSSCSRLHDASRRRHLHYRESSTTKQKKESELFSSVSRKVKPLLPVSSSSSSFCLKSTTVGDKSKTTVSSSQQTNSVPSICLSSTQSSIDLPPAVKQAAKSTAHAECPPSKNNNNFSSSNIEREAQEPALTSCTEPTEKKSAEDSDKDCNQECFFQREKQCSGLGVSKFPSGLFTKSVRSLFSRSQHLTFVGLTRIVHGLIAVGNFPLIKLWDFLIRIPVLDPQLVLSRSHCVGDKSERLWGLLAANVPDEKFDTLRKRCESGGVMKMPPSVLPVMKSAFEVQKKQGRWAMGHQSIFSLFVGRLNRSDILEWWLGVDEGLSKLCFDGDADRNLIFGATMCGALSYGQTEILWRTTKYLQVDNYCSEEDLAFVLKVSTKEGCEAFWQLMRNQGVVCLGAGGKKKILGSVDPKTQSHVLVQTLLKCLETAGCDGNGCTCRGVDRILVNREGDFELPVPFRGCWLSEIVEKFAFVEDLGEELGMIRQKLIEECNSSGIQYDLVFEDYRIDRFMIYRSLTFLLSFRHVAHVLAVKKKCLKALNILKTFSEQFGIQEYWRTELGKYWVSNTMPPVIIGAEIEDRTEEFLMSSKNHAEVLQWWRGVGWGKHVFGDGSF